MGVPDSSPARSPYAEGERSKSPWVWLPPYLSMIVAVTCLPLSAYEISRIVQGMKETRRTEDSELLAAERITVEKAS